MFKILIILCLGLAAIASNLNVQKGEIIAHTEVFGDSQINPTTKEINSFLTMQNDIQSIRGKIYFDTISLISQKRDRDSNMYELLNYHLTRLQYMFREYNLLHLQIKYLLLHI